MKTKTISLLLVCAMHFSLASAQTEAVADYQVIPLPQYIEAAKAKDFVMDSQTQVVYPAGNHEMETDARFLCDYIREATGLAVIPSTAKAKSNAITLALSNDIVGDEAYEISVGAKGVTIAGRTPQGIFYGIQTLRKSLPLCENAEQVVLPAVTIKDAPRFHHRGMMLDCCRHFFSTDFVKRYIDLIAMHNMNVFHWHLSDDQGWRIEIKKYPNLTKVGSMRPETVVGRNTHVYDGTPHGGFYSQDEIRDIVKYAADRFVTIIPEIDIPGHQLAALTSYPELGCTGGPYTLSRRWGVFEDVMCIGNEFTYQFCEDVLAEVMDLFPSRFIHIGGDEAPTVKWAACPKCQKVMKEHNLTPKTVQGYFTNRIEKFVNAHGRSIIGWDEILDGDINQSATIQSWRGAETSSCRPPRTSTSTTSP